MIFKTSSMFAAVLAMFATGCVQPKDCNNGKCAPAGGTTATTANTSTATSTKDVNSGDSVLKPTTIGDNQNTKTSTSTDSSDATDTNTDEESEATPDTSTVTKTATATATDTNTDDYDSKPIEASEADITQSLVEFDTKISAFKENTLDDLKDSIESLLGTIRVFSDARDEKINALVQIQQMRQEATAGLLTQLHTLAAQRQATRLQKYRELEALELAILDPLTAEGGRDQIEWDRFFAKLDIVREQSVKSEILATQVEMSAAVQKMYFADKNVLSQLVAAIIATNLSLVDASAPANAILVFEKLGLLEEKMRLATAAGDTQQIAWLGSQIAVTQQRVKLPLDAIDANIFPQVMALMNTVQTAEGAVNQLNQSITQLEDLLADKRALVTKYQRYAVDSRNAAAGLWPPRFENSSNRGRFYVGVLAANRLLATVESKIENLRLGINAIAKAKVKNGLPQNTIQEVVANELKVTSMLEAIRSTMWSLEDIADSIRACTADRPVQLEFLTTQTLHCDDEVEILYTSIK